jgi:hypothetical protein
MDHPWLVQVQEAASLEIIDPLVISWKLLPYKAGNNVRASSGRPQVL